MAQKLVDLQSNDVQIRMDLPLEDFRYFTNIIKNNVLLDWVENKKVDRIKESIESFISDTYKKLYVIVIGVDLAYNLSHKKNYLLIVKMCHITIFAYVPKPTEFPGLAKLYYYQPKDNNTELTRHENVADSEFIVVDKIKQYLQGIIENQTENLETQIVQKLKAKLVISLKGGYWHIFCSKRISTISKLEPHERYLEFQYTKGNQTFRVIAFQKQGPKFNLLEKVRLKTREIISFVVLLTFFATLVGCKENQNESIWGRSPIRNQICQNRSEVLGMCGVILFAVLVHRLLKKYAERGKKRKLQ